MKIQFNYSSVPSSDAIEEFVRAEIDRAVGRFADRLTRIEVHLADVNASKSGPADKRCRLEARPAGRDPLIAEDISNDMYEAISGAVGKLERVIMSRLDPHS